MLGAGFAGEGKSLEKVSAEPNTVSGNYIIVRTAERVLLTVR